MDYDGQLHAIANSMPTFRHLKLVGSTMDTDDGIRAILNDCPHLESLDIRMACNLEKLCRERIREFKFKRDGIPEGYEGSDMEYTDYETIGDWYEEVWIYQKTMVWMAMDSLVVTPSDEDDDDYYWQGSPNWWRICKDHAMWKVIDMDHYSYASYTKNDFEKLCKQAVHRSHGELMHIRLRGFVSDDLLDFISRWYPFMRQCCYKFDYA
ncbi:hypothetical protein OSB04_002013 [Centaurea solstitialis]|uniref:Uncharacterized protein n=1 Tax=Centaurea solstitialis TaxID=347529 RepID=A0AA38WMB5_9ASTR|nr:hypothetical protein OSB04_002013 [Centaurea solstitialis]